MTPAETVAQLIEAAMTAKRELACWLRNYGPDLDTSEAIDKIDAAVKAAKGQP